MAASRRPKPFTASSCRNPLSRARSISAPCNNWSVSSERTAQRSRRWLLRSRLSRSAKSMLEAAGEGTKMADHFSPIFRPAFPSSAIISERSSPSRVRFAAPNNGAPLTAPGRSGQHSREEGKAHSERPPWQGTTSPPFWYPFSPPPTTDCRIVVYFVSRHGRQLHRATGRSPFQDREGVRVFRLSHHLE